jgi:hypothetical protein
MRPGWRAIADLQNVVPSPRRGADLRRLSDNTMLVFLSDTHIGGDPGVNIFESAPELAAWFEEMSERDAPSSWCWPVMLSTFCV